MWRLGVFSLIDWTGVNYLGIDVVKSVIEKNQILYSSPTIQFLHQGGIAADLPSADLLICKDVLMHFPNNDILQFLPQLGKFKYCLITNTVNSDNLSSHNPNIRIGDFRNVDLTQPPFNVPGQKVLTYISGCTLKLVLLVRN